MRLLCPDSPPIASIDLERAVVQWIAEGCDLEQDVLPAVEEVCATQPDRQPLAMSDLAASIEVNRTRRVAPSKSAV